MTNFKVNIFSFGQQLVRITKFIILNLVHVKFGAQLTSAKNLKTVTFKQKHKKQFYNSLLNVNSHLGRFISFDVSLCFLVVVVAVVISESNYYNCIYSLTSVDP